jgi:hypothetical protein
MVTLTITIPDHLYERLKAVTDESAMSLDDAIISAISGTYSCDEPRERSRAEIEDERRMVREALKDISTEFDWDEFHKGSDITPMTDAERKAILRTLPVLDPPLSQTIIEDREDRI